jgi:superfamily II DNA or RNA helicase
MAKIYMKSNKNCDDDNIVIVINNIYSHISGLIDKNIIKKIDDNLSYYVQGYMFSKSFKNGYWDNKNKKWCRWDGKARLLSKKLAFRTGLLWRVENILRGCNKNYKIDDRREKVTFGKKIRLKNIESREYQDRIHKACLDNMSGVIKSCTGSGKSISIAKIIADTNIKTNVYVTSVDLLYQMKETFDKIGIKVGIIGDGKANIKKINIVSIWTACSALDKKYEKFDDEDTVREKDVSSANKTKIAKVIREAQMNIWDECHMVACNTIKTISNESNRARYTFGFSGTPWRETGDDILIEAICGKNIIEITASELIKKNYLVRPTIYMISVPKIPLSSDKYQSIYKEYVVENDTRNNKIIGVAKKLVDAGHQVLILVRNIKHGKILLENFDPNRVVFIRGELDSYERNNIRENFISGKIDIVIATQIFDQGVDLPPLSALILAGSGKASGRALQRLGRVIRPYPGKKSAIVIDMLDNCKYLTQHSAKRLEIYRTEAGFKIKLPKKKGYKNDTSKKKKAHKQLPPDNSKDKMPW